MTAVEFERRTVEIMSDEFVAERIFPLVPELSGLQVPEVKALLVRDIGTGRATVEYRIGDSIRLFAKLYSDDLGAHCYAVLKTLWDEGVARGERYRIPEPLYYSPDDKLLITGAVEGAPLTSYIGSDEAALVEGARESARWLARLHSSSVRVGKEGDFSAELLKLATRLVKAIGRKHREWERLLDLTQKLRELAKPISEKRRIVQAHGRFRHDHVFVGRDGVSVIDWDRSCPWDPAIDLAEFLHLLRLDIFNMTGNPALTGPPARAFLEEYVSRLPENAANLAFYWGFYILHTLSHNIMGRPDDDPRSNAKIGFHQKEFEEVVSGRFP
jgi:hypothetical protein